MNNLTKRFCAIILCAVMVVTSLVVSEKTIYAGEGDEAYVVVGICSEDGTFVYHELHYGEKYDGITFAEETNTVTIENLNIDGGTLIIGSSKKPEPQVNLIVKGKNTITAATNSGSLPLNTANVNLKITGDGELTVDGKDYEGKYGVNIRPVFYYVGPSIEIDGPTINVYGASLGALYFATPSAVIKNSVVNLEMVPCTKNNSSWSYDYFGAPIKNYEGGLTVDNSLITVNYLDSDYTKNKEGSLYSVYNYGDREGEEPTPFPAVALVNGNINIDNSVVIYNLTDRMKKDFPVVEPFIFEEGVVGTVNLNNTKVFEDDGKGLDISNFDFKLSGTTFTYTGKAIIPTVSCDLLKAGKDYDVTYANNVAVGKATVTVKGKGFYTGSKTLTFTIVGKAVTKGQKLKDKKYKYKVTKIAAVDGSKMGEVTVTGLRKKSLKKIKIATTVTLNGLKYKVTAVGKKAFKGNKKITSLYLGKNVKTIGAQAFAGCKKLKKVNITSRKLKKMGKNSFKGTKKGIVFWIPKGKKKAYQKLVNKCGSR